MREERLNGMPRDIAAPALVICAQSRRPVFHAPGPPRGGARISPEVSPNPALQFRGRYRLNLAFVELLRATFSLGNPELLCFCFSQIIEALKEPLGEFGPLLNREVKGLFCDGAGFHAVIVPRPFLPALTPCSAAGLAKRDPSAGTHSYT